MSLTKEDYSKLKWTPKAEVYTVEGVYVKDGVPDAPNGYEVIDFRPVKGGSDDLWLSPYGDVYDAKKDSDKLPSLPRLIIQKKKVLRSVIYHVIDRNRPAKTDEYFTFIGTSDIISKASQDHLSSDDIIYRREEVYE